MEENIIREEDNLTISMDAGYGNDFTVQSTWKDNRIIDCKIIGKEEDSETDEIVLTISKY